MKSQGKIMVSKKISSFSGCWWGGMYTWGTKDV